MAFSAKGERDVTSRSRSPGSCARKVQVIDGPAPELKSSNLTRTSYNSFSAEKLFEGLEEFVREAGCFSAKIIELLRELQFLAAVNFTGDGRYFIGGEKGFYSGA